MTEIEFLHNRDLTCFYVLEMLKIHRYTWLFASDVSIWAIEMVHPLYHTCGLTHTHKLFISHSLATTSFYIPEA